LIQAKKEQLKREGKLLTPKQKAEREAAERRKQAFLGSGTIGGTPAASGSGGKKVVYNTRKKGPAAQQAQGAGGSQAASSTPGTPQTAPPVALPPPTESVASESVRVPSPTPPPETEKGWDEESEGEKEVKNEDGAKSDWDASSGKEGEMAAAPSAKGERYESVDFRSP
jgi:translation initiation factor 5B